MGLIGWVIVIVLIIVAALAAVIWSIGAKSQRPRKLASKAEPDEETEWQPVVFTSGGSRMEGWLLQPAAGSAPQNEPPPVVIVAHGWGSNRSRVMRYAKPLYESGYAVFLYDARSHGNSDSIKAPSAFMFRDDALAAIDAVKSLPGLDRDRMAVLGHSLGGFGSLLALALGAPLRAVITDSMPATFDTMLKSELKRKKMPVFPLAYCIPMIWLLRAGISRKQFREADMPSLLRKHAGDREHGKTPVLMIHSNGDNYIPSGDLKRMSAALPEGTIQTVFVEAEGHSASERDPLFWRAVLPFLDKHLKR